MNDRERLIELLSEKCMKTCADRNIYVCTQEECTSHREKCTGYYADHLIANGVIVQQHGRWVSAGFMAVKCSECEEVFYELGGTNCCPNCGAKMCLEDKA